VADLYRSGECNGACRVNVDCGLEYTHVSFVRAVLCKQSSYYYKALQHSRKHYSLQTPLLQVIYKTRFVNDRYRGGGQ